MAAVALITGVITGFVGLAGLVANIWNSHKDRDARLMMQAAEHEERYRAQSYDKRLEVHQEGFEWTQKLGRAAFLVSQDPNSPETVGFLNDVAAAQRWLESRFLYLDPLSGTRLTTLFRMFGKWGLGMIDETDRVEGGLAAAAPPRARFWMAMSDEIKATQSALVNGIGLKHIDFQRIAADMQDAREEPHA